MSLSSLADLGFDVEVKNHAEAILIRDFPAELAELCQVMGDFSIAPEELVRGGGGESTPTQRLRRALDGLGWKKRNIRVRKLINGDERPFTTHEIDHFRSSRAGAIALEIEWNNKDPFFDRDLENFYRLHAENVISVGVIVTRGESLQGRMTEIVKTVAERHEIEGFDHLQEKFGVNTSAKNRKKAAGRDFLEVWPRQFVQSKFGAATTHWSKLMDRVARGVGNPCPLLLVGIPATAVSQEEAEA